MQIEALYRDIIDNLCDGVYFVDNDRRIQFWNKAAEKITGYLADEILGKTCQDTNLNHIDEEGRPLCTVGCPLYATIIDGEQRKARVFVRHKEGYRIPISVNIFPLWQKGQCIGAVEVFTQDSPTVYEDDLVEQLSGMAMHDALTGLPNRRYLESYLSYRLDSYRRFGNQVAVMLADIDNFKDFNTMHGHAVGDAVLAAIGATIKQNMRRDDLIGRWGGEEILGVFSVAKAYDAANVAEKFRQLIANTEVVHNGEVLSTSISVGITMAKQGDTIQAVVARADQLMYQSKCAGKDRVSNG